MTTSSTRALTAITTSTLVLWASSCCSLGSYEELKGKEDLNSHSRGTLNKYRRMLPIFKSIVQPVWPRDGLTVQQIVRNP